VDSSSVIAGWLFGIGKWPHEMDPEISVISAERGLQMAQQVKKYRNIPGVFQQPEWTWLKSQVCHLGEYYTRTA